MMDTREAYRSELAARIKDAYYAARDSGGTMHTAAEDAADAILDSVRIRDLSLIFIYGYEAGAADVRAAVEKVLDGAVYAVAVDVDDGATTVVDCVAVPDVRGALDEVAPVEPSPSVSESDETR